jgi:hypothetical protein
MKLSQNKSFRSAAYLTLLFEMLQCVGARPIPQAPGRSDDGGVEQFWIDLWNQFKNQYSGRILLDFGWMGFLVFLYHLVKFCADGPLKGSDLLPITMTATSGYSYYLGYGDSLSGLRLAMLQTYSLFQVLRFVQQQLSKFPESRKMTEFVIATISLAESGMLVHFMPTPSGSYENAWVQAAMLVAPTAILTPLPGRDLFEIPGLPNFLRKGSFLP